MSTGVAVESRKKKRIDERIKSPQRIYAAYSGGEKEEVVGGGQMGGDSHGIGLAREVVLHACLFSVSFSFLCV
jgi:hypothetical protein